MSLSKPESAALDAARGGDHAAFERLFSAHLPMLRGLLRRLVGHPDDVDDLVQQTLLRAWEGLATFRGESSPSTWLCAIGSHLAIDHLRGRRRWRERAQVIFAAECLESEALGMQVGTALADPRYTFDVRQHVAYCFTCIGRTLEPEAQAALVLRDVLEHTNEEAARVLGVSTSVLRHRLSAARRRMQDTFDGLCALAGKRGICWQCAGLRDASPPERRGEPPPERLDWEGRLRMVRDALLEEDSAAPLHDVFFRCTEEQEEDGRGDPDAVTDCGVPAADGKAPGN